MATQAKSRPHPKGIPSAGSYVTDCDRKQLFRVEAVERHKGVILENARTYAVFMLTMKEYQSAGFKSLK